MYSAALATSPSASTVLSPVSITCVTPWSRGLAGRCGRSRKLGIGEERIAGVGRGPGLGLPGLGAPPPNCPRVWLLPAGGRCLRRRLLPDQVPIRRRPYVED